MAGSFDLIGLADIKRWLDVAGTDDDILLARLIAQISQAILHVIDRPTILPLTYNEIRDGGNETSIMLRQWPVISVSSVTIDGVAISPSPLLVGGKTIQAGYVLDPSDSAPPGSMQRLSLRGARFYCGVQNVAISYTAGYQASREKAVIPTTSPYSISAQAPYGDWTSDAGVAYSNGLSLVLVTGNPAAGQYTVGNGEYTFAQADAGSLVLINYGYVPSDLASCCMEWVADRYTYRSRIGQQSKSLGGQETMAFIVKDIPDYVETALLPYRRVVMP
ncbi:hypothetical protein QEV83_05080 [Methylocapsa sp. D3K7]|uniref:hypothetical protein n=1 Tax=Methylocapsa sp. D3K7 TaxID=3041435 RepID=UPI00244EC534|nr:hypothetical protein [Methylocapsa sp. D3K7]WGJ15640.1 hypothetical protein QEV83_05080 [Methylocapsa sp. D3K7]